MSNSIVEEFYAMEYGPAPEDPKEVERWLDAHKRSFGHYIDGAWQKPASGEYFDTNNPATGDKIADVAQADAADVDAAVKAARKALPAWQALTGHQRARYLYALARQVQKHSRRLAVLETIDNGKPIRESRDIDIPLVARHFYHHAGWAQLLESEFSGYTACGVVGQIIPWNFPLLMFAWKVAPALAAGNTVVIKPAEYTPLTALALAELADEIGLPPGVLNVINGDGRTGALLVEHDDIDKIAFTGSTEVGRIIRKATAGSTKKLSLELGGKSPFIVFDDADMDSAVEGLVDGIWFNQGQVCCAGSRLLVQERIAEAFYAKVRARMETLRVGSPLDKSVDIGAIVAPVQLERIRSLVDQGIADGATCWQPAVCVAAEGSLLSSNPVDRCSSDGDCSSGRDLRPSAGGDDLPHTDRSRRTRKQHHLRAGRLHLERKHQRRTRRRLAGQGGRCLGQQHQSLRRILRLRRLSRERLRPRRRPRRHVRVSRACLGTRACKAKAPS